MIIGTIATCERYFFLGDNFKKALEFLKNNDPAKLKVGRYDIDGDKVFLLIQEYTTKSIDDCNLEAHHTYADIHYVIEGFEYMGYTSLERAGKPTTPFDEAKDVVYYEKECQYILLRAGDLAIVFPEDVHMPQKSACITVPVRKACIKVMVGQ